MKAWVFDIEVFPDYFLVCFEATNSDEKHSFEISTFQDDYDELVKFINQPKCILIGYNSVHYDIPLLAYAVNGGTDFYGKSQFIINSEPKDTWKFKKDNKLDHLSIDLMTMMASKALRVSLKQLQVSMKWHRVQDLPKHYTEPVYEEDRSDILDYCWNDVHSTKHLASLLSKDIALRLKVTKEYGFDALSKDGVGVAEEYLCRSIATKSGCTYKEFMDSFKNNPYIAEPVKLSDVIHPIVKFKTRKFNALLNYFSSYTIVPKGEYPKYSIVYNGIKYDFGAGGLHAFSDGEILKPKDDEVFYQIDVSGYYPSQRIKLKYHHRLDPYLLEDYESAYKNKSISKKNGDKLSETFYKLVGNAVFGKYICEYSPLYYPKLGFETTVNGQLMLAMLIEDLGEANIRIVGANTDAVEIICHESRFKEVKEICAKWESLTKMSLDYDRFHSVYRLSCNHYLAVYADEFGNPSGIKEKGDLIVQPRLGKGYDKPVVKLAVQKYFLENIPISHTIMNHWKTEGGIYDYCMMQKMGSKYTGIWNNEILQKTNRYYASTKGAYLYKAVGGEVPLNYSEYVKSVKESDEYWDYKPISEANLEQMYYKYKKQFNKYGKLTNVVKGVGVEIFNDFVHKDDYHINYNYYIKEAQKLIEQIQPSQTSLF
jgi:hypothetical protein